MSEVISPLTEKVTVLSDPMVVCKTDIDERPGDPELQVKWSETSNSENSDSDEAEIACDSDREQRDKDPSGIHQVQTVTGNFKFSFAANVNTAAQGVKGQLSKRHSNSSTERHVSDGDSNTDIAVIETEDNYINLVAAKQGVKDENKSTPRGFERYLVSGSTNNMTTSQKEDIANAKTEIEAEPFKDTEEKLSSSCAHSRDKSPVSDEKTR